MPRYARIHVTGGLFHIISRFHDRRYYLDIEGAREKYLDLLGKAVETHDGRIIAYCLMSTHIHLVMQLGSDPIGLLARKVHGPFGAWINKKRGGLGTILADRPKSVLVHSEMYGMELIRYVHNNPVRAGVVSRASESDWSSHCAYLGLNACLPLDASLTEWINPISFSKKRHWNSKLTTSMCQNDESALKLTFRSQKKKIMGNF